jgi:methylmalonyl-CoA mutase cobalamin-binding domain/chain
MVRLSRLCPLGRCEVGISDPGGVIPEEDVAKLRTAGVAAVFTMGARTTEIIDFLERWWESQPR